jgi:hypothetical protein
MLFKSDHLPLGFIFPDDPSHMKQEGAKQFLDFIRYRQIKHSENVFGFEYWLDSNGDLADPVKSWEASGGMSLKSKSGPSKTAKDGAQTASEESDAEESKAEHPEGKASKVGLDRNEEESLPRGSQDKGKERERERYHLSQQRQTRQVRTFCQSSQDKSSQTRISQELIQWPTAAMLSTRKLGARCPSIGLRC